MQVPPSGERRAARPGAALLATVALAAAVVVLTAPSPAHADREHTVGRGQTLARIASRYGVPVSSLAAANGLSRRSPLRPGQVLRVPPRGVVYVAEGDSLAAIARRHGVSAAQLARLNKLDAGAPLRVGQRLLLPGYKAAQAAEAAEKRWGVPKRRGTIIVHRLATRITRRMRVIDEGGRIRPAALHQLGALLRPKDTRRIKLPHRRLVRLLARVSDHFGGRPIHVVSGVRKPGGYTRDTSRHVAGEAIDFRIPGVPLAELRDYCAKLAHVGVGYYPRSNFVHLDVRRRSARWVDLSGPGEAPQLVKGPYDENALGGAANPAASTSDAEPLGDEPEAADDGQAPVEDPADVPPAPSG